MGIEWWDVLILHVWEYDHWWFPQMMYPPVIKHAWLENTRFLSVIFLLNPPISSGFPASHVWWRDPEGLWLIGGSQWFIGHMIVILRLVITYTTTMTI